MPLTNKAGQDYNKRINGLDNLRALAILLVLLFHYRLFEHPEWIDNAGSFGWTGVDLFFVLSGFLIAGQLFKQIADSGSLPLREFYLKRFFRIIPSYSFILILYFSVPGFKERNSLSPLWRYLTFTQNFGLNLGQTHAFTHAWSLCIEEQFYLLLPLILLCLTSVRKLSWGIYLIAGLWIAGYGIRNYSYMHFISPLAGQEGMGIAWYQYIYYPTYNRLDGLLTGVSIAAIFQFAPVWRERLTRYGNIILATGLLLLVLSYFLCKDQSAFNASVFGFPMVALGYGGFVIAAMSPGCVLAKLNSRILNTIAALSYSIYLNHKAVFHLTQQWFNNLGIESDSTLMCCICIIMAVLAGLLMHHLIERPFMRLKDRILSRSRNRHIAKTT